MCRAARRTRAPGPSQGISTDTGAFKQVSVRRIVDYAKAGVRLGANPYIGRLNNARVRAETIIKNVNQGADFSALAQQFSAAPSASAGGDLNWLSPGDMRPEIEEAVAKADKVPTILPPIESEGGIYIIALTGKREPTDPSKSIIFNLEQVIARGQGASGKLEALKAKAKG